jgi:hypothetical protein
MMARAKAIEMMARAKAIEMMAQKPRGTSRPMPPVFMKPAV